MHRPLRHSPWLLAVLPLFVSLSHAAHAAPPKLEPAVRSALRLGIANPRTARFIAPTPGIAPVMIQLDHLATQADLDALSAAGATLHSVDGHVLHYGRFVPANVGLAAATRIAALGSVQRVALAPLRSPHPIDHSAELIGLAAARGSRPALDLITGQNVVVADLDTNADIYHPQFFKADGGYYDWIDTNNNGVLDPGVDAIDLNADGKADAKETAKPIIAETLLTFYGSPVSGRDNAFNPSMDWLYLDDNANNARDYGAANGFDDTTPAFGEPLFVPDDANRNGKIDVGERVARLGTSKFRKVFVHVQQGALGTKHVYERGIDLSTLKADYTGGAMGYSDTLHASGVLSIVAGDVALPSRRWVGIAPDADLLLGFEVAQDSSQSITWALSEKPDVMLHETAGWTGEALDGSDVYSVAVDDSVVNDNVTHTCPLGNTGGARKHAHLPVATGADTALAVTIPPGSSPGSLYYVQMSFNFRGAGIGKVVLKEPSGQAHAVTGAQQYSYLSTGAYLIVDRKQTSRGTDFIDVLLYADPSQTPFTAIPDGTWSVEMTGDPAKDITLDAYISDNESGWGLGAAFDETVATDQSTVGIPAVADHCIAVGAHTGHAATAAESWWGYPEGPGELRGYSGQGPRIDGVQKPDITAPDNPWSAAPSGVAYSGGADVPHGAMWPMGGTSGATPHVTGVAALLAMAAIKGDEARTAIRDGAIVDAITGAVPNTKYGYGRLSAAGALTVEAAGKAPTLSLTAEPAVVAVDQTAYIQPTIDDPDGDKKGMEIKWDEGYNGTWDSPYGPVQPYVVKLTKPGRYPYKARVRDTQGRIADAVAWLEVVEQLPQDAGVDADMDAAADGEPVLPPNLGTPSGSSNDGCGCAIPGNGTRTAFPLAIAALGAALLIRRRRSS